MGGWTRGYNMTNTEINTNKQMHKDMEEIPKKYSESRRILRVFLGRKLSLIGLIVIFIFIFVAIFAPLLAPYDPLKTSPMTRLLPPSLEHPLGTDSAGRDTLSRIIYGARISLLICITVVTFGAIIGQSLGLIAAYFGGKIYVVIMRCVDALMSIPMLISAMVIAALLGGGIFNVIVALTFGLIPAQTRLMCGQALTVKQNDYVLSARIMGASNLRIMFRHILPNSFPPLIVLMTIDMGMTIMAEAMLSFLGIGIQPPTPAWGSMVSEGYQHLIRAPILAFAPGIAIMFVVFSFNMVGDGLRDALDPRLRGTL
jgi:ABC-type dipeptide/oligopeptide/nickel transport system permease subunit